MVRIGAVFAAAMACIVSSVAAHQNLHEFFVNGVSVGYEACIRRPPSNNPVTDVTSTDIRCNVNGLSASGTNPAPGVCNVNAGDQVTVRWDVSTHPSPIQHFLYGPVANASTADGSGTKWAKIDVTNLIDGQFANVPMESNGGLYTFTLPKNLATGDYLLRSEMLALHAAQTVGGAQFYIGCVQIHVTGPGGDCNPKFALPGVYTATEPEIYIPDLYNGFNSLTYTAPGPVGTCTATGGTQATSTIKSTSTVKPTSTSTKTSSTTKPASSSSTTKASSTTVAPTGTSCTVAKYGQCGGSGYTGCTTCVSSTCTYSNDFYSQCL